MPLKQSVVGVLSAFISPSDLESAGAELKPLAERVSPELMSLISELGVSESDAESAVKKGDDELGGIVGRQDAG